MIMESGAKTEYIKSRFEQEATAKMLKMSDCSSIRALHYITPDETRNNLTMLIIGGWGSIVDRWNIVTLEAMKDFNLVYFETREKNSSILVKDSKHDLDRISSDVKETIDLLEINEDELIIYASSWGAIIAAHGLTNKKFNPFLTVFVGPTARLALPPLTRYIIPIAPTFLFTLFKPITKFWIVNFKSENESKKVKYLRVVREANPRKWKQVAKHVMPYWYWDLYSKIESRSLIIAAEEDKIHAIKETKKIVELIKDSIYIDIGTSKNLDSPLIIDVIREQINKIKGK